jgi:ABC-2 type transport system permease protein
MKKAIFLFELRSWLRSPLFYFLAVAFFLFAFVSMLGTGGYFDSPIPSDKRVKLLNTPYALSSISFLLCKLLLFVVALISGFSLYKDYRSRTHSILYTFPISKSDFLNGKLGSALFLLILFSIITFSGIGLAELLLGTENPKIGPLTPFAYLTATVLYLVPTILVIAVFVFVTVGISRNMFTGFIVLICLVLLQLILENTFFNNREWLALLDPFGQNAFFYATQEWDFDKQNSTSLPLNKWVLLNRILWLGIATLFYAFFLGRFDFQYDRILSFSKKPQPVKNKGEGSIANPTDVPVSYLFSPLARLRASWHLLLKDFYSVLKSGSFLGVCTFGAFTVFFIQLKASHTGEFTLLPLTRIFIGTPLRIYLLVIIFSTFLFSGFLADKARKHQMDAMLDVTPVKAWQLLLARMGAIGLLQLVLLLVFLLVSMSIQIINGYYHFKPDLYLFHLLVLVFPLLLIWNLTSQFVHALVPNIFLGLFLLAGLWLGVQSLDQIGIHSHLFKFNTLPSLEYSDFNGYGHSLKRYLWLLSYWLTMGAILGILSLIIWNRGSLSTTRERWLLAKSRISIPLSFLLILLITSFLGLAFKLYKEERGGKGLQLSKTEMGRALTKYKNEWGKYKNIPSPKITDIELNLDLFPDEEGFEASGSYQLVNKGMDAIDTLLIRTGFDESTVLKWKDPLELLKEDSLFKSYLYLLQTPLLPGDSLHLEFEIESTPNRLFSRNSNVLTNGTYIQQDILPRLGYQFISHELPLEDSLVHSYNYFHRDADYVNIHTQISTSPDQIAFAPGELIAQTNEYDRILFEYSTAKPVKMNFSFHSARYKVVEEEHKGVVIQLFHLENHYNNLVDMMSGLKASLDYCTQWLGSYPYQQIRIIEFPHTEEGYAATLTANNIPASELLFNLHSKNREGQINLPFYVMAHELTHEWFGNQLMPADAEGAKMLTESIAEYLSLCIYEKHFGEDMADKFLENQYKRYHSGSKREEGEEPTLYKVLSHQEYLAYGKGAIAFYEIAKSLGKENFNGLLSSFLQKYKEQAGVYPTSLDFIQLLKANTPEEYHKLIEYWLMEKNEVE